jgi:hypothetical protein
MKTFSFHSRLAIQSSRSIVLAGFVILISGARPQLRAEDELASDQPATAEATGAGDALSPSPELLAPTNTLEQKPAIKTKSSTTADSEATEDSSGSADTKPDVASDAAEESVDGSDPATTETDLPDEQTPADDRRHEEPSADRARPMRSIVRPSRETVPDAEPDDADRATPEALPAPRRSRDLDDLPAHRRQSTFGVYLRPDTHDAVIEDVAPRSAAAAAGLRRGDLITRLDGDPVESADDFFAIAEQLPPDSNPKISVSRTIEVRLRSADGPRAVRAARYDLDQPPRDRGTTANDSADRDRADRYSTDRAPAERRPVRNLVPAPRDDRSDAPPERRDNRREGILLRGRLLGR